MHRGVGPAIQMVRKMAGSGAEPQILVQYLVLRKDLSQAPFSWPTGALVAQACHAATAALHLHREHPHTVAYLRELGRMRKVVLEGMTVKSGHRPCCHRRLSTLDHQKLVPVSLRSQGGRSCESAVLPFYLCTSCQ
ncbi:putative peptidyl-tRNA hydrolase PTRHD1 isoform X2 [Microtus ochrogaster]|uniref:peptidyl-tRNA hydrolase n=1 Tax=Microtus ochrogaster TaxID=79684 RepID=A0ABM1UI65_MICOH|nr:putative peptidyl-tRNA hydrolase PTRHD1 isoform X2 [Microtus ochrogaster]